MLRADIEDRQEGGFSERNRKVGANDAEVRNSPLHSYFKIFTIKSKEKLFVELSTAWMKVFCIEKSWLQLNFFNFVMRVYRVSHKIAEQKIMLSCSRHNILTFIRSYLMS